VRRNAVLATLPPLRWFSIQAHRPAAVFYLQ